MQKLSTLYLRIVEALITAACLCMSNGCISAAISHDALKSIASNDRDILETFFRKLLFGQGFAYTLFGDKPICVDEFDLDQENKSELFRTSSEGYMTWKKYVHLFPSQSHIFLFYENEQDDFCEITLINKNAFYKIIEKHKNNFEYSADRLLNLIIEKQSIWNTPLKDRMDLIGILLGYGEHNAELFNKRAELESRKPDLKKRRTQPSPGFDSIEEELNTLQSRLQPFTDEGRYTLCFMRLPGFVAERNHAETVQLKRKYREQRKYITKLYAQGNILDITLTHLCQ